MNISNAQRYALIAMARRKRELPRRAWWFCFLEDEAGDEVRNATVKALFGKGLLEQGKETRHPYGHWYRPTAEGMRIASEAIDADIAEELAQEISRGDE